MQERHDNSLETNSQPKVYIETYGCQMNFSDTEIIHSILSDQGFCISEDEHSANLIFLNTCAVRDNAEQKIRHKLQQLRAVKKTNSSLIVGILGCMAERLKDKLFQEEDVLDLIAGPDSYRSLPHLIELAEGGQKAANVLLSLEETYADINPVRKKGISAFISIMRGCNNMCAFCVVPFTRGRERSRSKSSILNDVEKIISEGFKEITVLGQNVNSYFDELSKTGFPGLLEEISNVDNSVRIRFTTSHPKDMSYELIETIAKQTNICNSIHLPVQSGSSRMLQLMKRGHTREAYLEKIKTIKDLIPGCKISTDIITGFCTETEEDHQQTLSLLEEVRYDYAFTFAYSVRPNTSAERDLKDDVLADIKQRRLTEVIDVQRRISAEEFQKAIGQTVEVLIEGESKRSQNQWMGRTTTNRVVVFPKNSATVGDKVNVKIQKATGATLIAVAER